MAILHVRNVPEEMHRRIERLARAQKRSLSAEVLALLERALSVEERLAAQGELLADVRRRRYEYPAPAAAPNSTALIREDRER
jgi:plasmid stability protein